MDTLNNNDILRSLPDEAERNALSKKDIYKAVCKLLDYFLKKDDNFIRYYYDKEEETIRLIYKKVEKDTLTSIKL